MTTDIAATALESAMSHRYVAGNAIFHSDRSSQYATGRSLSGRAPNDRVPVVQPYRQLPRQHHGRVALRHVEERDALQGKLRYQGRQSCRHRAHQGRLQPEKAPSTIGYKVPAYAMWPFFEHAKPESESLPIAV